MKCSLLFCLQYFQKAIWSHLQAIFKSCSSQFFTTIIPKVHRSLMNFDDHYFMYLEKRIAVEKTVWIWRGSIVLIHLVIKESSSLAYHIPIKRIFWYLVNVETNLNGMNLKGWSTFYLVWTTQTYVSKLHCQRALLFHWPKVACLIKVSLMDENCKQIS